MKQETMNIPWPPPPETVATVALNALKDVQHRIGFAMSDGNDTEYEKLCVVRQRLETAYRVLMEK